MIKNKKLKDIWWFQPTIIASLLLVLVLYAWSLPQSSYNVLYGVKTKAVSGFYILIYISSISLFILGVKTSKKASFIPLEKGIALEKFSQWLYILTILGYIVWFGNFVSTFGFKAIFTFLNPTSLSNNMYDFKHNSGRVAGLTSMTEIGVVVAPILAILYILKGEKIHFFELSFLMVLSIIRAALFSERLAFIEVFVPALAVFLGEKNYKKKYSFFPIIGALFVYFLFALFEYSRSWSNYYVNFYNGTYAQFALDRILGYYAVAINTECTYIEFNPTPYFPIKLVEWLYKLPLLSSLPDAIGVKNNLDATLQMYGNKEYNNPGGLLVGIADFGLLGFIFPFIWGQVTGKFFKAFKQRSLNGYIFYPILLLCLLELPRYFYFSGNRAFFVIIAIILTYFKIRKIKSVNRF